MESVGGGWIDHRIYNRT